MLEKIHNNVTNVYLTICKKIDWRTNGQTDELTDGQIHLEDAFRIKKANIALND